PGRSTRSSTSCAVEGGVPSRATTNVSMSLRPGDILASRERSAGVSALAGGALRADGHHVTSSTRAAQVRCVRSRSCVPTWAAGCTPGGTRAVLGAASTAGALLGQLEGRSRRNTCPLTRARHGVHGYACRVVLRFGTLRWLAGALVVEMCDGSELRMTLSQR